MSIIETSFPIKEENSYQDFRLLKTTLYKIMHLGTFKVWQTYDSKCPHYSSKTLSKEKTACYWAKQKETMLSACGWHTGFRDISYLHSETFLFRYFLEIRHPTVRSLQEWQRKYLLVPIIWHIMDLNQFSTRGSFPDVIQQDTAQVRGKAHNKACAKLQRNSFKTAQIMQRDKTTRGIWQRRDRIGQRPILI